METQPFVSSCGTGGAAYKRPKYHWAFTSHYNFIPLSFPLRLFCFSPPTPPSVHHPTILCHRMQNEFPGIRHLSTTNPAAAARLLCVTFSGTQVGRSGNSLQMRYKTNRVVPHYSWARRTHRSLQWDFKNLGKRSRLHYATLFMRVKFFDNRHMLKR